MIVIIRPCRTTQQSVLYESILYFPPTPSLPFLFSSATVSSTSEHQLFSHHQSSLLQASSQNNKQQPLHTHLQLAPPSCALSQARCRLTALCWAFPPQQQNNKSSPPFASSLLLATPTKAATLNSSSSSPKPKTSASRSSASPLPHHYHKHHHRHRSVASSILEQIAFRMMSGSGKRMTGYGSEKTQVRDKRREERNSQTLNADVTCYERLKMQGQGFPAQCT